MLAKRIIPCLDVKAGKVVKGMKFRNHQIVGDILELAEHYCQSGADELVFYDITASCSENTVSCDWVRQVAECLDIPFCVAGGIRSLAQAESLLNAGADKISINTPALENPDLINRLVAAFGQQCVVIGIDSINIEGSYQVCQYTGDDSKMRKTPRFTQDWLEEVQQRGAGEIVLNCMNQDGMREGYDIAQLQMMQQFVSVPLVASGGAGKMQDFLTLFETTQSNAALAASVFHSNAISIPELKNYLAENTIEVRL